MNEDTDINVCPDSQNCNESHDSDGIIKSDDSEIIECQEGSQTEVGTGFTFSNKLIDDLSLNMTKNKVCEGEDKMSVDKEKSESVVESQNSEEKAEDIETNETPAPSEDIDVEALTEEKILQVAKEDNSKPSNYSFCEWSENYDSLEDDRPMEDVAEDPQKFILWASEKDEVEIVRKLLEEDPSLVNAKDNDLYTPLHRAAYSNSVEVIKLLLSYDANISARTTDGWEPLHSACKWDSVEAVSLLLQNGADINALTQGNITPLHLAASNSSGRRTLEFLLWQPYIDPDMKNDAGDTPYDIAFRTGTLADLFEMLEESVNEY
ncbi:ankyrin repeat domain-containing protein 49 [Parasteatoda tepidariorum]|uniref:ankyrin repeat domain-containing protein 49 n=1 Tax=Parasteatoda tepidariorum TaxID=114398 RepID=UPI00077F8CA9|nr:ankyrin repeat domain-containing protein 49 [Parasteatoda tepidariorum]